MVFLNRLFITSMDLRKLWKLDIKQKKPSSGMARENAESGGWFVSESRPAAEIRSNYRRLSLFWRTSWFFGCAIAFFSKKSPDRRGIFSDWTSLINFAPQISSQAVTRRHSAPFVLRNVFLRAPRSETRESLFLHVSVPIDDEPNCRSTVTLSEREKSRSRSRVENFHRNYVNCVSDSVWGKRLFIECFRVFDWQWKAVDTTF